MSGFLSKSSAMVGPIKERSSSEEGDVAVSMSGNRKPALDDTPTAPPHKSWLLLCKEKKEICIQAVGKLKKLFSSSSGMDSGSNATIPKEEDISLVDESFDTILEQIRHGEKMLMANLPERSAPNTTLICAMFAIQNLSKIKPPLPPDVESGVLRFALHGVLSVDVEDASTHSQAIYKTSSDTLQAMLKGLLDEAPTTGHLLFILEDFDDLPSLGRHVAELALCLTDFSQDVSEQAREGIMCLYNVLLHRNELVTEAPWRREWQNNKEMLGYIDASKVGQMFAKVFNEQQRRSFLQTLLLAIYDPLPSTREAAVLLIYSLLGREKELLGNEVKEVKTKIGKEIHKLERCMEVTDLLQALSPSPGQLIIEDIENAEEF
ncbi:UNVERIFIED_CONTAM: hypothetical protein K2H54_055419 [Gekko kuhli]